MSSPNDDYYDGVVSTAKCVNHIDFDSINVAQREWLFTAAEEKFFRLHREVWKRRRIIQALVELTVIYRSFDILMEFFRKFDYFES